LDRLSLRAQAMNTKDHYRTAQKHSEALSVEMKCPSFHDGSDFTHIVRIKEIKTILCGDFSKNAPSSLATDAGDPVASVCYLYLITDNQGDKVRGKLAIVK
jgi:hypothetical protein